LKGRIVKASYGGETCQRELNQGCPQGSVIGPVLWNVVYNSLPKFLEGTISSLRENKVNLVMYADDLILQVSGPSISLKPSAELLLERIDDWGHETGMKFNPLKTEMLEHKKSRDASVGYIVFKTRDQSFNLFPKENINYLGILLDKRLNFKDHLRKAKGKVLTVTSQISSVAGRNWGVNKETMGYLHMSCIQPIILYGCEVWAERTTLKSVCR